MGITPAAAQSRSVSQGPSYWSLDHLAKLAKKIVCSVLFILSSVYLAACLFPTWRWLTTLVAGVCSGLIAGSVLTGNRWGPFSCLPRHVPESWGRYPPGVSNLSMNCAPNSVIQALFWTLPGLGEMLSGTMEGFVKLLKLHGASDDCIQAFQTYSQGKIGTPTHLFAEFFNAEVSHPFFDWKCSFEETWNCLQIVLPVLEKLHKQREEAIEERLVTSSMDSQKLREAIAASSGICSPRSRDTEDAAELLSFLLGLFSKELRVQMNRSLLESSSPTVLENLERQESMHILPLDFPAGTPERGFHTLEELLEGFFHCTVTREVRHPEDLKVVITEQHSRTVNFFPSLLSIQLKRSTYDSNLGVVKREDRVQVPDQLTFEGVDYRLACYIKHGGNHYITGCKEGDKRFLVNDGMVSLIPHQEGVKDLWEENRDRAYLLVYYRIDPQQPAG